MLGERIRKIIVISFTIVGIVLAVNYIFNLRIGGITLIQNAYLFALIACFLPLVFLFHPARKTVGKRSIPWYDWALFSLALACAVYLAWHGFDIMQRGWAFNQQVPLQALMVSVILFPIIIEAVRRAGGLALSLVCLVLWLYPLFAPHMPGPLWGIGQDFLTTATYNSMEAVVGITTNVFGSLLIGFMVFGVALDVTGGGKRLIDLAMALFGAMRGGAGKVGILAGLFFGVASGSGVANVVTCGSVTIPLMQKSGYSGEFAAAVSATSAVGGILSPPIMGAAAFIMASFLNISYLSVCAAAIMPSVLYYLCIFVQVDAHAARAGIKAIERSQLPSLRETLKGIWVVAVPIVALVLILYFARDEGQAPFYATALLLLIIMLPKATRLSIGRFSDLMMNAGKLLSDLIVILAGIGFVVGGLTVTGVAHAFSREIVALAGGNLVLLLILGAVGNIVLGLGMAITVAYIILAIVVAPILTNLGLDPVAVHLYVLYFALLSDLTPPVAVSPLVAAGIAKASFMKTCIQACRLGIAAYTVPFFFVLEPALIGRGPLPYVLYSFTTCALGLTLVSGALEGYLPLMGRIDGAARGALGIAGVLLALPNQQTRIAGAAILVMVWSVRYVLSRMDKARKQGIAR